MKKIVLLLISSALITVKAVYDDEADVWTVVESNCPGLFVEADSLDDLKAEVAELVPLLIEANTEKTAGLL